MAVLTLFALFLDRELGGRGALGELYMSFLRQFQRQIGHLHPTSLRSMQVLLLVGAEETGNIQDSEMQYVTLYH